MTQSLHSLDITLYSTVGCCWVLVSSPIAYCTVCTCCSCTVPSARCWVYLQQIVCCTFPSTTVDACVLPSLQHIIWCNICCRFSSTHYLLHNTLHIVVVPFHQHTVQCVVLGQSILFQFSLKRCFMFHILMWPFSICIAAACDEFKTDDWQGDKENCPLCTARQEIVQVNYFLCC